MEAGQASILLATGVHVRFPAGGQAGRAWAMLPKAATALTFHLAVCANCRFRHVRLAAIGCHHIVMHANVRASPGSRPDRRG